MNRKRGLTLIEILVLIAIVLVICAIAIPGLLSSQRASNERGAAATLKTVSSAEADFRANDRDGNGVNDFWTGDVKSLYTLIGPVISGPGDVIKHEPLRLIHVTTAAADADGTLIPAGGKNTPLSSYTVPATRAGYWLVALVADHWDGAAKAELYKQDTKGKPAMGKVHHLEKYGFAAFPDSWSQGKHVFIVRESNTVFRRELKDPARLGTAIPPGLEGVDPVHLNWPEDQKLQNRKWSDD